MRSPFQIDTSESANVLELPSLLQSMRFSNEPDNLKKEEDRYCAYGVKSASLRLFAIYEVIA